MDSVPENELIARCCRGEEAAWDELFRRHYAPAGRFVFQFSPELTTDDVDEICQETFLAVIKNLAAFQQGSKLQTWICRIAANKARDFLEKKRAAKRGGGQVPVSLDQEDPDTGLHLDPPSPLPAPDKLLAQREGMEMVADAVAQLEVPCREVIELRYFADLSYEDIAAELDLNLKTVSSRLSKCLDRLEKIARTLFHGKKNPVSPSN